jgi:hypothetical protein
MMIFCQSCTWCASDAALDPRALVAILTDAMVLGARAHPDDLSRPPPSRVNKPLAPVDLLPFPAIEGNRAPGKIVSFHFLTGG